MAADLQADDAARKGLDKDLCVSPVVAEIDDDQGAVVVRLVNGCQRVGTCGCEQILWQLMGDKNAELPMTVRIVAADHRG